MPKHSKQNLVFGVKKRGTLLCKRIAQTCVLKSADFMQRLPALERAAIASNTHCRRNFSFQRENLAQHSGNGFNRCRASNTSVCRRTWKP